MIKLTKEEVSLCNQVAERYRKDLHYGDWYIDTCKNSTPLVAGSVQIKKLKVGYEITKLVQNNKKVTPLWTISDCLEFLRERGFTIIQACEHPMSNEWIVEVNPYFSNAVKIMGHKSFDVRGDTLLIACLKALLTVLEEEKEEIRTRGAGWGRGRGGKP